MNNWNFLPAPIAKHESWTHHLASADLQSMPSSISLDDIISSNSSGFLSSDELYANTLTNSSSSGTDSSEYRFPQISISVEPEFYLREHVYSNNQGKYLKVLQHQLGEKIVFVERDKAILLCFRIDDNSGELTDETLNSLRVSLTAELTGSDTEAPVEENLISTLMEFQGINGGPDEINANLQKLAQEYSNFPFKKFGASPNLRNRCVLGVKFKHLNSKFGRRTTHIHIQVHYGEGLVAENRFRLMCCASPTRDASRFMQRNPLLVRSLSVSTLADALFSTSPRAQEKSSTLPTTQRIKKRKRSIQKKASQFDFATDQEGNSDTSADTGEEEEDVEDASAKRKYVIKTSDFGIYCVLQRMAHELANYRDQLRIKNPRLSF